jgi:hypothetical protein
MWKNTLTKGVMPVAEGRRKSIFKRWWFWVIVVIIIIAIASGSCGGGSNNTNTSNKATKEKVPATQNKENKTTQPAKNSPKISKAEFNQLKNGMTYDEVVKIIGSKGELLSSSGQKGTDTYTTIYSWDGEGSLGANANVTFQGGKLISKAQFGVQSGKGSNVTITMSEFNKVQNGMNYDQVQKIIGGPGELNSESGQKGTDLYTAMYSYNGKDLGSNAIFTFQGGKLVNKTQIGLK